MRACRDGASEGAAAGSASTCVLLPVALPTTALRVRPREGATGVSCTAEEEAEGRIPRPGIPAPDERRRREVGEHQFQPSRPTGRSPLGSPGLWCGVACRSVAVRGWVILPNQLVVTGRSLAFTEYVLDPGKKTRSREA
ncbi:hypothetical protein GCM10010308_51100 [Streptomyces vinaceusdrappus]|nr:hypothetical protein GCM10010301_53450 [Streptomyces plicatus]GHC27813.1 hypothetical protein GCM10010308_51100 [Streptomyces vinaceusdrappus]